MSLPLPSADLSPSAMKQPELYVRRTGVAFLSLAVLTSCIPWMELVGGQSMTSELVLPGESRVAFGTCFLAGLLVIVAWFSGRRRPVPANPRIARPRDLGLQLAVISSVLNLALAGVIRWLGPRQSLELPAELWLFAVVWYLLILPMQVLAAFCKGRASKPFLKRAVAS